MDSKAKPTRPRKSAKKPAEPQVEVVLETTDQVTPEETPVTSVTPENLENQETQNEGKQDENTPDVVIVTPPENPEDEKVTADLTPVATAKAQSNVKVATNRDHTCSIGGIRYNFYKGKQQSVPVAVKEILLKSNLLLPL